MPPPLGADLGDHATVILNSTMRGRDFPALRLKFWRQGACVQLMLEPLLFVSGAMCDGRLFAPQIAEFSAGRPAMIVPPVGAATNSGLARRILDLAPPAFALAGLSMGGIVPMKLIRQARDRLRRMALMDTNPFPEPPERAALRDAQVRNVMNADLPKVMRRDHAEPSREALSEWLAIGSLPEDGGMSRAGGIHRAVPRGSVPTGPE